MRPKRGGGAVVAGMTGALWLWAGMALAASPPGPITRAAVWRAPANFTTLVHERCDGEPQPAFGQCFLSVMAAAGASPAAMDFARRMGDEVYLAALADTRPVAAALVFSPFRANENYFWLLVNGTPSPINVDDQRRLALDAMRASPAYRRLLRRYPRVSLWPDGRYRPLPAAVRLASGGRRFIISYRLQDFCHACAIVGRARFGFDFDAAGKFLGTRFLGLTSAAQNR